MKKALSFILALALVISLVPTVAFAAGEMKTFDFGEVAEWTPVATTTVKDINAPMGVTYIPEKSTNKGTTGTKRVRTETRELLTQIQGRRYTWLAPKEGEPYDGQLMFTANLGGNPSAGWYQIEFTGGDHFLASDLYIYANDTYVGEYIPDRSATSYKVGSTERYGAIYLEPNDAGNVTFLLAVTKLGKNESTSAEGTAYATFLLKSLSLTYLGTNDEYWYRIAHTIPDTLDLTDNEEGVDFRAYLDAGDGIPRAMNGIDSEKNKNDDTVDVEILSGDSLKFESTTTKITAPDGIASGKLVPVKTGATKLKITAKLGTETYTAEQTITVTGAAADADAEDIDNKISYIVRAEDDVNNDKITVSDTAYTEIGEVGEWTVGESFTATATGSDFAYWANGNGTHVSGDATYTFTATSNFTLRAIYDKVVTDEAEATEKKVEFWNGNGVLLGTQNANDEGKISSANIPEADAKMTGYAFVGWLDEDKNAFTADSVLKKNFTRVVAQFTDKEQQYSITFDDATGADTKETGAYGKKVTYEASNIENFDYWKLGNKIVSYDEKIEIALWGAEKTLTAEYNDDAAVAKPTVVLDDGADGAKFLIYAVPEGYEIIDAGIVFGTEGSTPRVASFHSKASVKKLLGKRFGQFTSLSGDTTHTVARGYLIYKDPAGVIRVIYAD